MSSLDHFAPIDQMQKRTFSSDFARLREQLATADNQSLTEFTAQGGWRKILIDGSRASAHSRADIGWLIRNIFALIVITLPPLGARYRRALVAQSILDGKAAAW